MPYIIILGLVLAILLLLIDKIRNKNVSNINQSYNKNFKDYKKKNLMTNAELEFYNKFSVLENIYKIVPQINLATIINKISNSKYQNELYRNIDFAIFSYDYSELLLLIELNDSSHNDPKRIKRDKNIKNICNLAGINLITFYTKYPNEKNYVINRIQQEINKTINAYNQNISK